MAQSAPQGRSPSRHAKQVESHAVTAPRNIIRAGHRVHRAGCADLGASRHRPLRSHARPHGRGHADRSRLRQSAFLRPFRCHRRQWRGHRDAMRDARGHGAAPFGLVARHVRAGRRDQDRRPAASRRSALLLCGYADHRRRADAAALSAIERWRSGESRRSAVSTGFREAESRGRLGSGAVHHGAAAAGSRQPRAGKSAESGRSR